LVGSAPPGESFARVVGCLLLTESAWVVNTQSDSQRSPELHLLRLPIRN
jgi:hypothetical protein